MSWRICINGKHDATENQLVRDAHALGLNRIITCRVARLYFVRGPSVSESLDPSQIQYLSTRLLADPVVEDAHWEVVEDAHGQGSANRRAVQEGQPCLANELHFVEVAFRPGVTDVSARELRRAMIDLGLPQCQVATGTHYEIHGPLTKTEVTYLAKQLLCNETIERYAIGTIEPHFFGASEVDAIDGSVTSSSRHVSALSSKSLPSHLPNSVEAVQLLDCSEEELESLSQERLLSLDCNEMSIIQTFYRQQEREPTDVELETLAQTWSEHCVHKTFKAQIELKILEANGQSRLQTIDGLFQQYIQGATQKILADPAKAAWVRSVFVDDAGIVNFDDQYDLAFKVETHNHPSALEPFGGANTGIGGVVRDIIGVSARPIATTDVLCFGPQDIAHDSLPDGILHPRRIADGVVAGISDYGNKLGLPTVNGAVIYDPGYVGNPLVFCGCVGLVPKGSHPTNAQPGDQVVVIGGRTGRDGIHGATFSSAELSQEVTENTGSAVQIGDPITEKGVIEVVEAARDERLYNAITDCGAGGFSSAVGEMGEELGVDIELTNAPLKYTGLAPWEIWLSEAQERMVLAVPEKNLARFQELAELWGIELCVLGHFTDDGELRVRYQGDIVGQLSMDFLHNGLPQRRMTATWKEPTSPQAPVPEVTDFAQALLSLLSYPTVASKEKIVRQYDHEIRGGTLVRPFVGPEMDGPADAALLKPLGTWQHNKAFTLSAGVNPLLGKVDPYAMAVSAVDEAFRNAVAVGADPDQMAILDNFCWGNPTYEDRLGELVRACQGCYDAAVAYGAPFISGKDSLYNEFEGQPIPGTLLISALGIVPDLYRRTTSDLKMPANLLFLVGETQNELGGSLLYTLLGYDGGQPPAMPTEPLVRYRAIHQAISQGVVQSCHDLSEGGLAVALAEMALAGRLGVSVNIQQGSTPDLTATELLFSESNGRLLLEIRPEDVEAFHEVMNQVSVQKLGHVTSELVVEIISDQKPLVSLSLDQIIQAWKRPITSDQ
ncbi:MAG: phosphoribosylformylglycinamidine synthase subunit PurL [Chloroflexota bacterium]